MFVQAQRISRSIPVLMLWQGRFAPTPAAMLSMGRAGSRSPVLATQGICSQKRRLKGVVVVVKQALFERMSDGASTGREHLAASYRRCLYYQAIAFQPQ